MRQIYVDIATNGLWDFKDKGELSLTQPHLVRLALLEVVDSEAVTEHCHLVKMPRAAKMTPGATVATGIMDYHLDSRGVGLQDALNGLSDILTKIYQSGDGDLVVFNWGFMRKVLDISYRRVGYHLRDWSMPIVDLMTLGAPMVGKRRDNAPPGVFLFPKFDEMTYKAIGSVIRPTNNPIKDGLTKVRTLERCRTACLNWRRQQEDADC